jgi:hypothetical protein
VEQKDIILLLEKVVKNPNIVKTALKFIWWNWNKQIRQH